MKLYFYIFGHNGDIHFVREYIKDIISKTDYEEYYLLHNCKSNILLDIPKLKYGGKLNKYCLSDYNQTDFKFFTINDEDTYVNLTSINWKQYDYHKLFVLLYHKLLIKIENFEYYTPVINYDKYNLSGVIKYLRILS
jgi:hypothetical protein